MNKNWLKSAADRYEKCNREILEWIVSRTPLSEKFLDTKVNSMTGLPYGAASGLRGPAFTYGWIQGRGLEVLITFSDHYSHVDPSFSDKLLQRAKLLFDSLHNLYQRDKNIYFLYDTEF
jgi:hypothetical protein